MKSINQRYHKISSYSSKHKIIVLLGYEIFTTHYVIYMLFTDCGVQSTHGSNGIKVLSKMATHGDWPWHVALFKEDVHICDGTLVAPEWVATTTSCFQGQPKAEWTARFAVTRLFR